MELYKSEKPGGTRRCLGDLIQILHEFVGEELQPGPVHRIRIGHLEVVRGLGRQVVFSTPEGLGRSVIIVVIVVVAVVLILGPNGAVQGVLVRGAREREHGEGVGERRLLDRRRLGPLIEHQVIVRW